jgi:hypothetical protein
MSEVEIERWGRGHEVALLAILELIPGVGGAVATIVDGILDRRRERGRDFGAQVLGEVVPEELLSRLRADYRFGDLFVAALERVAVTGWKEKREAMGRVVVQALNGDDAGLDESERLLTSLHELDRGDFAALARLDAERRARDEAGSKTEIDQREIQGLGESIGPLLRHRALAQETAFGAMGYRPTPLGQKLLALVTLEPGDPTERESAGAA